MAALTLAQLEAFDLKAGWPAALVPTAAAVEQAESGGNPGAVGPQSNGDRGSWGLFQVQTGQHPALVGKYGQQLLSDPLAESQAGLAVYRSQGWDAWSTYSGGEYQKFLSAAQAAAGAKGSGANSSGSGKGGRCNVSTGTWTDVPCSGIDPACGVDNWAQGVLCKLSYALHQLSMAAQIVGGMILIGAGLWLLIKDTGLGREIKSAARTGAELAAA